MPGPRPSYAVRGQDRPPPENKLDRLPALAADLVHRQVAVIVGQQATVRAARAATSAIPIVFVAGGDPIAGGFVTSLSRPGGNITGVSFASAPLQPKRLGLLHELVPPPATIAWLRDLSSTSFEIERRDVESAARELGRHLLSLDARSPREIDAAFATIVQSRAGALLIGTGPFFNNRRRQLAALAARHGVPAIAAIREFVVAGGLMSYGASDADAYRRAGSHYVGGHSQGREAGRLAGRDAKQVRAGHQCRGRQSAGPGDTGEASGARRRGDRIGRRFALPRLLRRAQTTRRPQRS